MLDKTDEELGKMGWRWILRDDDGQLLAVTTNIDDAFGWLTDNRGVVSAPMDPSDDDRLTDEQIAMVVQAVALLLDEVVWILKGLTAEDNFTGN